MSKQGQNDFFEQTSFLQGVNAAYIEDLYSRFQDNPGSVTSDWRAFFGGLKERKETVIADAQGPSWKRPDWPPAANGELVTALAGDWADAAERRIEQKIAEQAQVKGVELTPAETMKAVRDSIRALMLIRSYRVRGHLAADLDPLRLTERKPHPELQPETYGFGPEDMDRLVYIDKVLGLEMATIRQIVEILRRTYCGKIGVEFMHISVPQQKAWIQERIEGHDKDVVFTDLGKKAILAKLIEAETFEKFLDKKYTGTKRFGLDGAEAMVPALEQIIKRGGQLGVREIVLGMAHRGRLNVLANVLSKPYRAIFHEFKGGSANPDDVEGSGDVKYHLGASSDRDFDGNNVHLSLTANPSHLEIVDPVVLGKVRAKQDQAGDKDRTTVLPLLIHGDAAFAGQGVVAECFGLSGLKGHRTGGSIHFIVNNQIGFTTAPRFARSSPYPSDVARMIEAPIFHVNGDDPEAVVHVAKIATEFRQQFHKPVVIDMFCYRRFGHNEGDEPAFTQPLMYKRIREHGSVTDLYGQRLTDENLIAKGEVDELRESVSKHLESEFELGDNYRPNKADWLDGRWSGLARAEEGPRKGETGMPLETLRKVGEKLTTIPKEFNAHRTIERLFVNRRKMIEDGVGIDWAMAESLALGTLVNEGFPVRLSGQDVERGTFSQRHAVLVDQVTEKKYTPINHIAKGQAKIEIINSMLSEEAVLGFEYGFSLAEPMALVLWEAQFGDFANGAQVVIDQFLSSGERKWLRMSGLVMLLPHGYEGQGPEHSSARLERFLQLSAEDNWQVANVTTPANYFHILRRQMHRKFRKPLILMTPKSLLRHKRVTSEIADFGPETSFHRVLWDGAEVGLSENVKLVPDNEIKRVVMCSGKVYYDLFEEREARKIDNVYLMRIEQLYPFPARALIQELGRFPQAEMIWCQEEPKNMGSWNFIEANIEWVLDHLGAQHRRPRYVGRAASAATATGLMRKHLAELRSFVDEALTV
ncbi:MULTISPECIES: 2-oxoglutarate dehydrogenase E1 component [Rhodomicrobium]|uniref:2-oxoglutarate dehydrogenase E1 component n=1 Tax=Rhodomicrobium TaxID=1068 RepID=UPI000B4AF0AC|nr:MULTISPECIES: 2-oxoglutarate dehydrogenase E1 component [Rhodomicrobium]